jgi:hypothetical protein
MSDPYPTIKSASLSTVEKLCRSCGRNLPLTEFYKHKTCSLGVSNKCKECQRLYGREWSKKNRKRLNDKIRERYHEYSDTIKEPTKRYRQKIKLIAIEKYGGKCACCGESEIEFLTIDHVNNDGNIHRKKFKGISIYQWLKNNNYPTDGIQLLCWNCNCAKAKFGSCPHQRNKNA